MKTMLACVFVALLLAACGGGDEECRPDFVGPPAPSQAHLPVCGATEDA
jgi:hypothetical protein